MAKFGRGTTVLYDGREMVITNWKYDAGFLQVLYELREPEDLNEKAITRAVPESSLTFVRFRED